MSKNKLLKNIEEGLLNYYLEKDYSASTTIDSFSIHEDYEGQLDNYSRLAKQILFKTKAKIKKDRVTKIISLAEASGRLKSFKGKDSENVFSIFKKHIEKYGLAANYRNFDKMTTEEMSSLLEQLDLTTLFDEIDESLNDE